MLRSLVGAVGLVSAAFTLATHAPPPARPAPLPPPSCIPAPPLSVEILEQGWSDGTAVVRYRVRAGIAGTALRARVRLPAGATPLARRAVRAWDVAAGEERVGSLRARVPAEALADLVVAAELVFPTQGGEHAGAPDAVRVEARPFAPSTPPEPDLPEVASPLGPVVLVPAVRREGR